MGQTVFTLIYDEASKGLAALAKIDGRFKASGKPVIRKAPDIAVEIRRKREGAIEYEFDITDDVFTSMDKARALSNQTGKDVIFYANKQEVYIPHGQTATITYGNVNFDLAPDQKAREQYDANKPATPRRPPAETLRPPKIEPRGKEAEDPPLPKHVHAPDAIHYQHEWTDDVFESLDKARALSDRKKKDVYLNLQSEEAYLPYGKPTTVRVAGVIFDLPPGQPARQAYEAARNAPKPSQAGGELGRILDSGGKRPGTREIRPDDSHE